MERANNCFLNAKKMCNSESNFGKFFKKIGLFSTSVDYYNVFEEFRKAGYLYRSAKAFGNAVEAFEEAAKIAKNELNDKISTAGMYGEAASLCRKSDPSKAINLYLLSKEILIEIGNYSTAVRHIATIAEIYEKDTDSPLNALKYYQEAVDLLSGSPESQITSNRYSIKVAEISADCDKFHDAATIFEEIGDFYLNGNVTLKRSAITYYFKAVLCEICYDVREGILLLNILNKRDSDFRNSNEHTILIDIVDALEFNKIELFEKAVKCYEKRTSLDKWTQRLISILEHRLKTSAADS